jgi:uncharacterized HAD superfamily protein
MKRLKIGLDIDGVIVDYMQPMLSLLGEACDRPVAYEEISHWDIARALNVDEEIIESAWMRLFNGPFLLDAPPVEGALEGMKLFDAHELWIVTGRPSMVKKITEAWFRRYGVRYDKLLFVRPGNKLSVAQGFDVFVDDFLDEAVSFGQSGVYTLLYDRPWNQSEILPESCRRVHNWETIVSLVQKLEEQTAN